MLFWRILAALGILLALLLVVLLAIRFAGSILSGQTLGILLIIVALGGLLAYTLHISRR